MAASFDGPAIGAACFFAAIMLILYRFIAIPRG
jgi:hypothetical protein